MARISPYFRQLVKRGDDPIFTKLVTEGRQPHLSRDEQFRYGRSASSTASPRPSRQWSSLRWRRTQRGGKTATISTAQAVVSGSASAPPRTATGASPHSRHDTPPVIHRGKPRHRAAQFTFGILERPWGCLPQPRPADPDCYGVYSSALASSVNLWLTKFTPPAASTCPSGSRLVVWSSRAVFMAPVAVQALAAGL